MTRNATQPYRAADLLPTDDERWSFVFHQFINLVDGESRNEVQRVLTQLHGNGEGLRRWINDIAYRGSVMPATIPKEVLSVYFTDPEALPLHDCSDCGLSVPVRPNRISGTEGEPEEDYFPCCPVCGGDTGLYCYWSRRDDKHLTHLTKPR